MSLLDGKTIGPHDPAKKNISSVNSSTNLLEPFPQTGALYSKKSTNETISSKFIDKQSIKKVLEASDPVIKELVQDVEDDLGKKKVSNFNSSGYLLGAFRQTGALGSKKPSTETINSKLTGKHNIDKVSGTSDLVTMKLIHDAENDPLECALKSGMRQQSNVIKPNTFGPKRQVIQLNLPVGNRSGYLHRLDGGHKRFKPPRLDDWFRPILEIDYFMTVGLASAGEEANQTTSKLKEVPVCFQSPNPMNMWPFFDRWFWKSLKHSCVVPFWRCLLQKRCLVVVCL